MQSMLSEAPGVGRGIGARLLGMDPTLAASMLGTGANVYGATLEGGAMDRQFGLQEEALALRREEGERREKLDRLQLLMSQYGRSRARF